MSEEPGSAPAERVAINEVTFRRANETLMEAAERADVAGLIPFICECGDAACFDTVQMSVGEYEAVRQNPLHFLVASGHAITGPDLSRVVRSESRYTVVEKIGISGEIARERDPRQEPLREAEE
jgi:hypothetical protein